MLISHKGHNKTIQVYSMTVMTHVEALQAGQSSQGTSEPITPAYLYSLLIFSGHDRALINVIFVYPYFDISVFQYLI